MKKLSLIFLSLLIFLSSCEDEEILDEETLTCQDEDKSYKFFSKHSGTVWYRNLGVYEFYYRINQDSFDDYYIDKCFNYPAADCEYDNKGGTASGMYFEGEKYTQELLADEDDFISFKLESGSYIGIMSYSMNDTGDTLTFSLDDNLSFDKGMWFTKSNVPFPNVTCD
tara:strand:- start:147 stop:650 length:504 start_codon:yes stop_codon:yes gene_type:complete